MREEKIIKLGDIDILVKRCLRSRNIKLRAGNKIELIIPKYASFEIAYKFLLTKELWIRNHARAIIPIKAELPKFISILGKEYEIILNDVDIKEPIVLSEGKLLISKVISSEKVKLIISIYLKKLFKRELDKSLPEMANKLNVKYNKISVRDTTSRWGSCSSSGNLSFSWRLILAPPQVMEYVIVHELCHLQEMNHSHRFWNLVASAFPEHKSARTWLKNNGKSLHLL